MSGRGMRRKVEKRSRTSRAGLQFPVAQIYHHLKEGNYAPRISECAAIYLAAILEYLTGEVLELAEKAARNQTSPRIIPRHLQLSIRYDLELDRLLSGVTIAQGGAVPDIRDYLLQKMRE